MTTSTSLIFTRAQPAHLPLGHGPFGNPPLAEATPAPEEPGVLLLLGGDRQLSDALTRLGAALDLRIRHVASRAAMLMELQEQQPIGLACGLSGTGATAACQVLKDVARFNPALPVLLVTDGDPETLGCLDAIAALCGVSDLVRLTAPPRVKDVLAFVARAGRRSGRLALMAV